ncbi:MAG: hypothetical protein ACI82A_002749 [Candidatus Azotimanducaceae bacterium]|jgi:hypothetical protein
MVSKAKNEAFMKERFKKDKPIIDAVVEAIKIDGKQMKTDIIAAARDATGDSKKKIIEALNRYEGVDIGQHHQWTVRREGKNAHIYKLNPR